MAEALSIESEWAKSVSKSQQPRKSKACLAKSGVAKALRKQKKKLKQRRRKQRKLPGEKMSRQSQLEIAALCETGNGVRREAGKAGVENRKLKPVISCHPVMARLLREVTSVGSALAETHSCL